jgi:hypothetical protein
MTQQEYQNQNKQGFENDIHLRDKFFEICRTHKVTHIIETGTYHGHTTKHLCKMAKRVDTVEVVQENFTESQKTLLGIDNVYSHFGNSSEVLPHVLPSESEGLFLFLDAHWQQYNPLLDELKVIAGAGLKPIIAIHDFKAPNRPDLGFDTYPKSGIVYEWDWIKSSVENIYGVDGYTIQYNDKASGAKRGVIFIFPVKNDCGYNPRSEEGKNNNDKNEMVDIKINHDFITKDVK